MQHLGKIYRAFCVCWVVVLVVFAVALVASSQLDWMERALVGPGGFLLGLVAGFFLFGFAYQTKNLRPHHKKVGMTVVAGLSLVVATANLVWGFAHAMPHFDVALGLGFSGAGLIWLRRGMERDWG